MLRMLAATVLVATSMGTRAQSPAPPAPPAPPISVFASSDDVMMLVSPEFGSRTIVKGAPYSATAVNENRQVLNDGNRIERTSTTKLYRDGQGRTRQEQPGGVVFINDVVDGRRYVLNTQRKQSREIRGTPGASVAPLSPTASMMRPQPPQPPASMTGEEARSWAEEMRQWGREFSDRMRGEQHAIVRRGPVDSAGPTEHIEVIRLHHSDANVSAPRPPVPPVPPMMTPHPPGRGTTTSLGNRDFNGVRAQGTKTVWTIAAESIGNKLPIEIVSERWYAPDLNLVLLSRHADPRSGERIYRLENISREEPTADLFKVPAEFATKAMPTPPGGDRR